MIPIVVGLLSLDYVAVFFSSSCGHLLTFSLKRLVPICIDLQMQVIACILDPVMLTTSETYSSPQYLGAAQFYQMAHGHRRILVL